MVLGDGIYEWMIFGGGIYVCVKKWWFWEMIWRNDNLKAKKYSYFWETKIWKIISTQPHIILDRIYPSHYVERYIM